MSLFVYNFSVSRFLHALRSNLSWLSSLTMADDPQKKHDALKKTMQKSLKNLADSCSSEFHAMKDQFQSELDGFYNLFENYVDTQNQTIEWEKVNLPEEDLVVPYSKLNAVDNKEAAAILSKVFVTISRSRLSPV